MNESNEPRDQVAIVGMALRVPKADSAEALWALLREGREGLTRFEREELLAAGVPENLTDNPSYVPVNGTLADIDLFDADFFSMSPREARITDPQHRVLLELAWQALEDAGYEPARFDGSIGVYTGCGPSSYLLHNLWPNRARLAQVGELPLQIGNNKDYVATRISYKLNLTGPSVCVTTACSTSLVAVHLAVQSLLEYQCDMALAGGAGIQVPQDNGYLHQEGGILSPDGHCRAFDARASGTVNGNGAGLVVLRRLEEALADGDRVLAVIRGSAINNDGADKAGFTAPSAAGQAKVIREAHAHADVDPETIGYVETHGTGTPLGDPIEVAALNQAFRGTSGECFIGSVKTNLGHLDEAAGIVGLIKTALCLEHQAIPASLHFETPNPEIDFAGGPFTVNAALHAWAAPKNGTPRRAGVSSFGIGGSNAHVVLEEAPPRTAPESTRPAHLLPLSAPTAGALADRATLMADWFNTHPDINVADTAFTLQCGRRAFQHRSFVVAADPLAASAALNHLAPSTAVEAPERAPQIVFLCSGQGSQYPHMARSLFEHEDIFRNTLLECAENLRPHLGLDLLAILYPDSTADEDESHLRLRQTAIAQPALFAVQYAMAAQWRHWGVTPAALVGHSLGEYVAACLAGVISLESALRIVAVRGQLMQSARPGAMLAVPKSALELNDYLEGSLELAAVNAPDRCVVSGPRSSIDILAQRLEKEGSPAQLLAVSHAFHSALMAPVLDAFAEELSHHSLRSPELPYVSNLTGTWITADEARDPQTYVRQLRSPVLFANGISRVLADTSDAILLEIGPGQALVNAARRCAGADASTLASLPQARSHIPAHGTALASLGSLWQRGVKVKWSNVTEPERVRVALPGYPFERKRYWIDAAVPEGEASPPTKLDNVSRWFYTPFWRRLPTAGDSHDPRGQCWLILSSGSDLDAELVDQLQAAGATIATAYAGACFEQHNKRAFSLRPGQTDDFAQALQVLAEDGCWPERIVHLWSLSPPDTPDALLGFHTLTALAQAIGSRGQFEPTELAFVCSQVEEVTGDEPLSPRAAAPLGAVTVIPQELQGLACRSIDIDIAPSVDASDAYPELAERLYRELTAQRRERRVALRGRFRWAQGFEALAVARPADRPDRLKHQGVYLITGGLGQLGLLLAEYLAERASARLVLIGRTAVQPGPQAERLAALRHKGVSVLTIRADVRNVESMLTARASAEAMFGRIDGIIHAATVPAAQSFTELRDISVPSAEREFDVKGGGIETLERVFADQPPDFYLLFSSLSAVLGGLGFAAYAGANHILDATARRGQRQGEADWLSVNWDAWDLGEERSTESSLMARLRGESIAAHEGLIAFDFIFDSKMAGQIAVSTSDLASRLSKWRDKLRPVQPVDTMSRDINAVDAAAVRGDTLTAAVADIWCNVLGLEHVGPDEDFFTLNGDSLLGTQLVAQLNQHLGGGLGVRTLFENPTVAGLSDVLRTATTGTRDAPIARAPRASDYPLSNGQKRIWLLSQTLEGSVAYNMSYNLRVCGDLDVGALTSALQDIVARHESLRTAFVTRAGEPRQQVCDSIHFELTRRDLGVTPNPETTARQAVHDESLKPFALTCAPLFRTVLLRLSDADHVLLITFHHIVADGLSLNVFMRELHSLYSAHCDGRDAQLPVLDLQYSDYAVWFEQHMRSGAMAAHRNYWLDKLDGGTAALDLPADRTRGTEQDYSGGQVFVNLSTDDQARLQQLSRDRQVTLFMILTAAVQVLLHHSSGQDSIAIGTPVAGRDRAELEGQIGLFLNNVVLREHIIRRESFSELLERVGVTVADAFEHQTYPFDQLVEDLGVTVDPGRTPLFDIMLNLMPSQALELRLGDLELSGFEVSNETTLFDLNIMITDGAAGIAMEFAYNKALYDATRIERLAAGYVQLLQHISADAEVSVRELCAALGEQRDQAQTQKAEFLAKALNLDESF
jgi:acyl transferase domain-containing protein